MIQQNQFNQKESIGTSYEGYVKIPKPKGIKSGWKSMYMFLSDFKLYLYEAMSDQNLNNHSSSDLNSTLNSNQTSHHPNKETKLANIKAEVYQILDMKNKNFRISDVTQNDVIHANKKEIPLIFKISTTLIHHPNADFSILFMAESQSKKRDWIKNVSNLLENLSQPEHPQNPDDCPLPVELHEAYDSTLPTPNLNKGINCASVYTFQDPKTSNVSEKIVLGTEDGLYSIDTIKDEIVKVSDSVNRQIYALTFIKNTNGTDIIAVISGKQRHVRLHQLPSLEGPDAEVIKIDETKGSMILASGAAFTSKARSDMLEIAENGGYDVVELARSQMAMAKKWVLAVMLQKTKVFLYDISFKTVHKGPLGTNISHNVEVKIIHRVLSDYPVTSMQIYDGRLILGHPASFSLYAIYDQESCPTLALVQDSDKTLQFLKSETALCAIPILKISGDLLAEERQRENSGFTSNSDLNELAITNTSVEQYEYLLCFKNTAVYVDAYNGTRTRQREIQYPSEANAVCYNDKLSIAIIFTSRGLDILDPKTAEFLQSIPIKNPVPLNSFGRLIYTPAGVTDNNSAMKFFYLKFNNKCNKVELSWYKKFKDDTVSNGDVGTDPTDNSMHPSHSASQRKTLNSKLQSGIPGAIEMPVDKLSLNRSEDNLSPGNKPPLKLLLNRLHMGVDEPELRLCARVSLGSTKKELRSIGKRKWRYSVPINEKRAQLYSLLKDPQNRSNLISGPSDFSHVGHIGNQGSNRFDSSKMIDLKEVQRREQKMKSVSLERGMSGVNLGVRPQVSDGHLINRKV